MTALLSPMDRMIAIRTVENLLREGLSLPEACRSAGISRSSFDRWMDRLENKGDLKTDHHLCGRSPKFNLDERETATLRNLTLEKESVTLAIELFSRSPECRPETRSVLHEILDQAAARRTPPRWPRSILRAAHVTRAERALFRGPKATMAEEMVSRRCMEIELEDGRRIKMGPNMVWESDDMSANEPFSYLDSELGRGTLGRQVLCTLDVYRAAWLSASPLGRERDAYRVEDIMGHLWDTVSEHGLPMIWRLERGAWENNAIDGIPLKNPAPSGVTRWGGLGEIIRIVRAWKSKQKGSIEAGFDFLQSLLAHESTSIGRRRGEFESATSLARKASEGDPEALKHFWSISEAADGFARAMSEANARGKVRRSFGRETITPDDLGRDAIHHPCPPEEAWRFLPEKREAVVRGGHVEFVCKHYPLPFRFRVNGEVNGLHLDNGYRVLVAFHPGRPDEGCHIFNGEIGVRNREGYSFGEPILLAPMAEDAPQVSFSRDRKALVARKNANAAMRSSYRAIVGVGRTGQRTETARDGYGDRTHISRTSDDPTPGLGNGEQAAARPGVFPPRATRSFTPDPTDADLEEIERKEREAIESGTLFV